MDVACRLCPETDIAGMVADEKGFAPCVAVCCPLCPVYPLYPLCPR
jgi:hypothetical protein